MKTSVVLLAGMLVFTSGMSVAGLYRWVDERGKVHYGDEPPPKTKVESKQFGTVEQNEDISYEARRAQKNFPVTLYVGETCVQPCIHARALLRKRGVPFSEKVLKTKSEIDEFAKLSGSYDSPTLAVGSTYLKGFEESRWNNELDLAGYPKMATYRQRTAPSQQEVSDKTPPDAAAATPAESQPDVLPVESEPAEEQAIPIDTQTE